MNIMTECPLEHQASFSSLGEESARDYASRHAQLSLRGKQVLDRLLVLLPSHLKSQPTSRISLFSPALLFSICDVLQHGRADSSAEQDDTSVLPSVLSKLRDWRLLGPNYRYSTRGVHKLALDLAGITDEASASTSSDVSRSSHGRLRMKWVGSDSPNESQDRESSSSPPPSSSRSAVLDSPQECAHVLPDLDQRRSDSRYEPCQASRLGAPDSEDPSAVVSRRHHSVSGFRSGCSACRHLRVSGPSAPPSPQMPSLEQRTLVGDVNQFDTNISTSVPSPRHPKPSLQRITTKKTKRENQKSLQSLPRGAHVDENEPPLAKPPGVQQAIGISFPRQRTHSPRISNAFLSREPFSPVATSVQRRMELNNFPNRTREDDKHTFSHRVTSVDLLLPIVNQSHTPTRASPIDLHPYTPNRAQSFSYTPVNSYGFGSVAGRVPKLSSNAVGQSSKRLPSWSQTHRHDPATTTSAILNPTAALSPPPAKARSQNTHSSAPSRPWLPSSMPSDAKPRDRRSVSSQTHKHTQSAGFLPLSPLPAARKWHV